jgi:hypothetical protein
LDCIVTRVVPSGKWKFLVHQNRFTTAASLPNQTERSLSTAQGMVLFL